MEVLHAGEPPGEDEAASCRDAGIIGPVVGAIGTPLGLIMLLNTWGVVWRVQKRLIAATRASAEQGISLPPEAAHPMRWGFLTARTSFWLSFPMLFFMGAASHYPFLSTVAR